ncbi:MAG: PH domain-containing protein [Eggerthellaceae bacterium]|nr:PH domain-containing protein [Eggerthellaceae bacterium]
MREMPEKQLDPRVKNVWRIVDALWVLIIVGCIMAATLPIVALLDGSILKVLATVELVVLVALLVVVLFVLPPIRYVRWRYQVTPEYLDIAKGIIWRKRYTIPFIRVQNTDTRQGPVLRMFGLANVTVATAAKEHEIPGLDFQVAGELRDRAAELARLAREDV